MRFLLLLFYTAAWAILLEQTIDTVVTKYNDSNHSIFLEKIYGNQKYFVMIDVEKKLFSSDTLDDEKPFLKAGIKETLFRYTKQKHPKLKTLEISGLLHGKFWQKGEYFYHIAHIDVKNVKPLFENIEKNTTKDSAAPLINSTDIENAFKDKISYLEEKQKKYPKNMEILDSLRSLYKDMGDVEGYESVNERIMDAKMDI